MKALQLEQMRCQAAAGAKDGDDQADGIAFALACYEFAGKEAPGFRRYCFFCPPPVSGHQRIEHRPHGRLVLRERRAHGNRRVDADRILRRVDRGLGR